MEATQKPDILKYAFMVTLTLFVIGLNASLSLKELAEGVMVILALFTIPRWREWPKFDKKFLVVLFLWVAGAFISYYVFAPIDIPVEKTELPNFRWVFFFFAVVILAKFYLDWNWLQKMLAVVFAVSFVVDLVLYYKNGWRAWGMSGSPINFANLIAPFILISWGFVLQKFTNKKMDLWFLVHVICVVLGSGLVIASQTRGVVVALFPMMAIAGCFYGRKLFFSVVVLFMFVFIFIFAVRGDLFARLGATFKGAQSDISTVARIQFWRANLKLWQSSPFFGVGYGVNNFLFYDRMDKEMQIKLQPYQDLKVTHAHNQYIHFLAGGGLWGLGCYLVVIGIVLRRAWHVFKRQRKNGLIWSWGLGLLGAYICFLGAGLTEANFTVTKNRYVFVLLIALTVAWSRRVSTEKGGSNESIVDHSNL